MTEPIFYRNLSEAMTGLATGESREIRATWEDDMLILGKLGKRAVISFQRDPREIHGHLFVSDSVGELVFSGHHANSNVAMPLDLTWQGLP